MYCTCITGEGVVKGCNVHVLQEKGRSASRCHDTFRATGGRGSKVYCTCITGEGAVGLQVPRHVQGYGRRG